MAERPTHGSIVWTDLTVPDAEKVRDFYPNLDASIKRCVELGGKVIDGPRSMGERKFCVIQDPAGAVAGLIGD